LTLNAINYDHRKSGINIPQCKNVWDIVNGGGRKPEQGLPAMARMKKGWEVLTITGVIVSQASIPDLNLLYAMAAKTDVPEHSDRADR
jgi:hypothetical protein